jgi:hypothetical protein
VIKRKRGPGFDTTRGDAESIRVPYRRKTQQLRRGPRLPDGISRAIAGPDPVRGAGVRRSGTCPSSCSSTTEWIIRRRCVHRSGRRVRQQFFAPPGVSFAGKALGFAHLGTAGWLLSLTWAAMLNFAAGYHVMV